MTETNPTSHKLRANAFTIVEMVVVIAIILVILGMVLPAITSVWDQRKISDAENMIQGMLKTARASAMTTDGVESGLFFFVDGEGQQRMVGIERSQPPDTTIPPSEQLVWQNVFTITQERTFTLPAPMRVVPRYVVMPDEPDPSDDLVVFSLDELANDRFTNPVAGQNKAQRHRNFFSMVYSHDGHMLVRRDVLLIDGDLIGAVVGGESAPDGTGDVTGLPVGANMINTLVEQYWDQKDVKVNVDPTPNGQEVEFLVTDGDGVAVNFPSVDGLLVYDDSLFTQLVDAAEKRNFILRTAQPFYVSRLTGAVVRGPVGKNKPE